MTTLIRLIFVLAFVTIGLWYAMGRVERAEDMRAIGKAGDHAAENVRALPAAFCDQIPETKSKHSQEALKLLECDTTKAP